MFIWLPADLRRSNYCSLGRHIGFQDYPLHTVPTQGHGWEPVLGGLAAEYVHRGGGTGLQGDPSTGRPGLADLQSHRNPGIRESQTSQAPAGLASLGVQSGTAVAGPCCVEVPPSVGCRGAQASALFMCFPRGTELRKCWLSHFLV